MGASGGRIGLLGRDESLEEVASLVMKMTVVALGLGEQAAQQMSNSFSITFLGF